MALGEHPGSAPDVTSDEWLTPPDIIKDLGPFDLDPCTPIDRPWDTATVHRTKKDLLFEHWPDQNFVWLNPPYSSVGLWMAQLASHPGGGIALVFARTETAWFVNHVWKQAIAVAFLHGRVTFHTPDGQPGVFNAGAPSCLVAYGEKALNRFRNLHRPHTTVVWKR